MRLQSCLIMWSIGFEIEFLENCNVSICTFRIYFYPKGFLLQDWMLFFSVVQIGRPFWLRNGWKKVNFRMQKCTEEWICKAKEKFFILFLNNHFKWTSLHWITSWHWNCILEKATQCENFWILLPYRFYVKTLHMQNISWNWIHEIFPNNVRVKFL